VQVGSSCSPLFYSILFYLRLAKQGRFRNWSDALSCGISRFDFLVLVAWGGGVQACDCLAFVAPPPEKGDETGLRISGFQVFRPGERDGMHTFDTCRAKPRPLPCLNMPGTGLGPSRGPLSGCDSAAIRLKTTPVSPPLDTAKMRVNRQRGDSGN
jgi:hypothetical protein